MALHLWALTPPDPGSQYTYAHPSPNGTVPAYCAVAIKLQQVTASMRWVLPVCMRHRAQRPRASAAHFSGPPYLLHYFDGFHPVLGWGVKQHAVIEGLEHRLHGVHRPHEPDQLRRDVIDGPRHRPAQGWRRGGAAWAPAVVRDSRGCRVRHHAGARAAAVGGADGSVLHRIPQDHDEGRAEVLPGKGWEEK